MPQLTAQIGSEKYRLKKYDTDSYDIQQNINGVWNTVDTFGKVYGYGGRSSRPWGYLGYSFSTAGLAFKLFVERTKKQINLVR